MKALRERPSVVVTDLEMPTMDGFPLLRLLKADPLCANIPVLILNSRKPEVEGTRITRESVPCSNVAKSIACKKNITLVNIVGGFFIGIAMQGMSLTQAAQTYTTLTVGDGLVSQVPALMISIATGLLVTRVGEHWPLLLSQVLMFNYVYPGYRDRVPEPIRDGLLERAMHDDEAVHDPAMFRGTLVSRFSFAIDVNEWGLRDLRTEAVAATRLLPVIEEIGSADVWDAQEGGDD